MNIAEASESFCNCLLNEESFENLLRASETFQSKTKTSFRIFEMFLQPSGNFAETRK